MQAILCTRGNPVKTCVTLLIQELVDSILLEKLPSLEWGKDNEHNAAAAFMKLERVKHSHPKLLISGLFNFKSNLFIVAIFFISDIFCNIVDDFIYFARMYSSFY